MVLLVEEEVILVAVGLFMSESRVALASWKCSFALSSCEVVVVDIDGTLAVDANDGGSDVVGGIVEDVGGIDCDCDCCCCAQRRSMESARELRAVVSALLVVFGLRLMLGLLVELA